MWYFELPQIHSNFFLVDLYLNIRGKECSIYIIYITQGNYVKTSLSVWTENILFSKNIKTHGFPAYMLVTLTTQWQTLKICEWSEYLIILVDIVSKFQDSLKHWFFEMFLLTSVGSYINYQEYFSSVLLTKVRYGRFVYHGKVVAVYPLRVRGTVGAAPWAEPLPTRDTNARSKPPSVLFIFPLQND